MRRLAREHLVEQTAEAVDVGARVEPALARRLLGAHVTRRAEREPGLGHAIAAGLAHRERDPEVGDERRAIVQEDVLGLDVAMDDAVPVRVVERRADLLCEPHRVVDGKLVLALEAIAERLALDERHHVEQESVGLPRVEQRQDVRMLQRRRRLDLGEEPIGADDGRELGAKHLHRNTPVVLEIVREIDGGHPTGAELALESVTIGQRCDEARRRFFHVVVARWGEALCDGEKVREPRARVYGDVRLPPRSVAITAPAPAPPRPSALPYPS